MSYNEADTRANLIDPKLIEVGWENSLISREFPISIGRIEVIGETSRRASPRKADYILRLTQHGEALAVIEAKEEGVAALKGMPQAKDYAQKLGLLFAYATNGHEIEEFNFITKKQTTIEKFPTLQELKNKYTEAILKGVVDRDKGEKIINEPYYFAPDFYLRYYQEAAVKASINSITTGNKKILLNLATGTGKTVIAFNLVWKLLKSGYFKRILFISDRNFLRNQAYNTFAPFGEGRGIIEEGKTPKHNDVYFSIYQSLYSLGKSGKRLYEEYPHDFFDLIIIDECHRSGFGTWNDILKYFSTAVTLGMTATPKRSDNIDTYKYFGDPVYVYSYGQGVQDGYLAPFIVHRILTNIDKEGHLSIEQAKSQGAEIVIPEEEEPQEIYSQKEFERKITLPDRTHEIARHLAKLLRTFDPMAKTMVFCVDSDHADLMAKELQNEFSDLGFDNFAVSIIARNEDILEGEYERFKDSEKPVPVIATTVDLLTTGIDVPSVRNVVIIKPISSKLVFKQVIGRGCRIDDLTGKSFFRIIDYIGATKLFDDWEKIPEPITDEPEGEETNFVSGLVVDAEMQEPIVGATITLQRKTNEQLCEKTDHEGSFTFSGLPAKKFHISIRAFGFKPRTISIDALDNPKEFAIIELEKMIGEGHKKVIVTGLPIHIAEEDRLVLEKEGKTLNVEEYVRYASKEVVKKVGHIEDLRTIWVDPSKRKEFLDDLSQQSIYPEVLAELLQRSDLDGFDILSQVTFGVVPLSRDDRVEALLNKEQRFISAFSDDAKEIIYALLEKYRLAGIENMENPMVFELPPFDKFGKIEGVQEKFGDIDKLKVAISGLRNRLYPIHV